MRFWPCLAASLLQNEARLASSSAGLCGLSLMLAAAGDQANETLLHEMLADSVGFGGYDVIIDDGGHTSHQMLTSIKVCDCAAPLLLTSRTHAPTTSDAALLMDTCAPPA